MVTLALIAGGFISIQCNSIISVQDDYPGTLVIYETALTAEREVRVAGSAYHVRNKVQEECDE